MDSAKLNDWMQVVGIFAVVASLVFVGLQMKQSQEIAIAAQYHDRAALAVENFHAIMESGRAGIATSTCPVEPTADLSTENIGHECLRALAYLVMADNHLYQYVELCDLLRGRSGGIEFSSRQALCITILEVCSARETQ